jgi:hypothetical protein
MSNETRAARIEQFIVDQDAPEGTPAKEGRVLESTSSLRSKHLVN